MKLTVDVINDAVTRINSLNDRELVLRDLRLPAIENLGGTKDLNDTIDFCNNDLKSLENFPRMLRLKHLLMANNRISHITNGLEEYLPNLKSLILTNNAMTDLAEVDALATLPSLEFLSFLDNPVSKKPDYRLYVIHKLPQVRVLDFKKVSQKEREQAQAMFQ
ncbi:L domain-like protein [Hesseltinella vesiculosa]|uniref:U2 small nuclear ribonucleoprotein A' n=1 Tax=Hesseltinella vesiculosa TaxID=101127 RepID=A0A1X2G5I3_9FUNG|nr:L domain-like protein [Hesseltinella vesiculosa]